MLVPIHSTLGYALFVDSKIEQVLRAKKKHLEIQKFKFIEIKKLINTVQYTINKMTKKSLFQIFLQQVFTFFAIFELIMLYFLFFQFTLYIHLSVSLTRLLILSTYLIYYAIFFILFVTSIFLLFLPKYITPLQQVRHFTHRSVFSQTHTSFL